MPRGVRDGWRVWALALVAAAIAVTVSLLAAGPVAAVSAASHYDTAAYSYDAPALLSSPDTVASGIRGSPSGPGAMSWVSPVSAARDVVAANSVRSAAPSSFTRAEALSGRASQRTVNEIAESMRADGWQGAPIDVVELQGQRIVVDGHHRLAAARRAGIDVQYRVVDPSAVIGPGRYTSIDDILQSTYSVGRDRLR